MAISSPAFQEPGLDERALEPAELADEAESDDPAPGDEAAPRFSGLPRYSEQSSMT
jgi:hypothetical protein